MSQISVTAAPQAIYPDGFQESFIIYNAGPSAVVVDSDSAISDESMQIPPTGYLAWDQSRPLWVKARVSPSDNGLGVSLAEEAKATITITRNSQTPDFSNARTTRLLKKDLTVIMGNGSQDTGLVDCSAYKSLTLTIQSSTYYNLGDTALSKWYTAAICWLDSAQNFLSMENLTIPAESAQLLADPVVTNDQGQFAYGYSQSALGLMSRVNVKVKGAYFIISLVPYPLEASGEGTLRVVGSTIDIPEKMSITGGDWVHIAGAASTLQMVSMGSRSQTYISWGPTFRDLILPNLGPRLRIAWSTGQTVTVAGTLRIDNPLNAVAHYGTNIPIPATAIPQGEATLTVPLFEPVRLRMSVIPQIAGPAPLALFYFNLTWFD